MAMIIKPNANVISLTSQNTVYGSTLVYLAASGGTAQVNVYSNATTQYASFVVPTNMYIFLQKTPTDLLTSNVAISATPAAFKS